MANNNKVQRCIRRVKRKGASAVEFAIVLPFLMMILLGTIEFGRAMMVQHILTMAAREGARESILLGSTEASVKTVAKGYLDSTIKNSADVTITVSTDPSLADAGTLIETQVSVPFGSVGFIAGKWMGNDFALTATATMRKEGFR